MSQQAEAILALMYPFEWHLPYVPMLPHDCVRDFLDEHVVPEAAAADAGGDDTAGHTRAFIWVLEYTLWLSHQ